MPQGLTYLRKFYPSMDIAVETPRKPGGEMETLYVLSLPEVELADLPSMDEKTLKRAERNRDKLFKSLCRLCEIPVERIDLGGKEKDYVTTPLQYQEYDPDRYGTYGFCVLAKDIEKPFAVSQLQRVYYVRGKELLTAATGVVWKLVQDKDGHYKYKTKDAVAQPREAAAALLKALDAPDHPARHAQREKDGRVTIPVNDAIRDEIDALKSKDLQALRKKFEGPSPGHAIS